MHLGCQLSLKVLEGILVPYIGQNAYDDQGDRNSHSKSNNGHKWV